MAPEATMSHRISSSTPSKSWVPVRQRPPADPNKVAKSSSASRSEGNPHRHKNGKGLANGTASQPQTFVPRRSVPSKLLQPWRSQPTAVPHDLVDRERMEATVPAVNLSPYPPSPPFFQSSPLPPAQPILATSPAQLPFFMTQYESVLAGATTESQTLDIYASSLRVMNWNIFAHQFTDVVQRFHRTKGNDGCESHVQTRARYEDAAMTILLEQPDVLMLQECSPAFLDPKSSLNPHASVLMEQYTAYCCFGAESTPPAQRQMPGCAILVRRSGELQVLDVVFAEGDEDHNCRHNCSIAVLLHSPALGKLWMVTLHQAYEAPPHLPPIPAGQHRGSLLQAIHRVRQTADNCGTMVVGGCFNASVQAEIDHEFIDMTLVEQCTWLGQGMTRVQFPKPPTDAFAPDLRLIEAAKHHPTGLNPSWSIPVSIDHFYISADLGISSSSTGGIPRCPYNLSHFEEEWKGSAIQAPSDHTWLLLDVHLRGSVYPTSAPSHRPPNETGIISFGKGAARGVPWHGRKVELIPSPAPAATPATLYSPVATKGPAPDTRAKAAASKGAAPKLDSGKNAMPPNRGIASHKHTQQPPAPPSKPPPPNTNPKKSSAVNSSAKPPQMNGGNTAPRGKGAVAVSKVAVPAPIVVPPIIRSPMPELRCLIPTIQGITLHDECPEWGRRIAMTLKKFRMEVGEEAAVVGESKSGQSWELDNGKSVLKDHEGRSWVWADHVPLSPPQELPSPKVTPRSKRL